MPSKRNRSPNRRPVLKGGLGGRMTAEQAALLRRLAQDAYEPDAFNARLTQTEAATRIAMLEAKLRLLDAPPHTL